MLRRLDDALTAWWPRLLILLVAADVCAGVFLRFYTTSKLWLDEALSVNIASHPLSGIVGLLRHDGAPPLYYVILHVWMSVVGHSDAAVRALSGVFGLAGLAVMYAVAKKAWDTERARLVLAVGAILPFAVYYSTETRMYSLVALEVALLALFLLRVRASQKWSDLAALCLCAAALLYTQYWALYLIASLVLVTAVDWWKHPDRRRLNVRIVSAYAVAGVLWLPWLPIFNSQRLHTATPWARHPQPFQFIIWPEGMWVNQSVQHVSPSLHFALVSLVMVILLVLGVFAVLGRSESGVLLEVRPEREISFYAGVGALAVFLGMLACDISGSAYAPRYSSIVVVFVVCVIARGLAAFGNPRRIFLALAILSLLLLWTDRWGAKVQRTQAGVVAHQLSRFADIRTSLIAVCPDQIGPTLSRYISGNPTYVLYPRLQSDARIVNWYDYPAALASTNPRAAARRVAAKVKPGQTLYIAWAEGYTLKDTCQTFADDLAKFTHRKPQTLVVQDSQRFYQSMTLVRLAN